MPRRKLSDEPIFYVYALIDPRTGETFYIGKGKNKRAYQHALEVRNNTGKNARKCLRIREILDAGLEVTVVKLADNLCEGRAYGLEAKLIEEQKNALTNGVASFFEQLQRDHLQVATWCNRFRWSPIDWLLTYYKERGRSPEPFELETYKRMRVVLLTALLRNKEELQRYEPSEKQTS